MKKLLVVAVAALMTTSAFANKMMVKLDGCLDNGRCDSVDFNRASDDVEDEERSAQTLMLNLAYAITPEFGVGLTFGSASDTKDGDYVSDSQEDNYSKTVISAYYNLQGAWDDSCFVALHLGTTTYGEYKDAIGGDEVEDSGSKVATTTLEYGHRFKIANAWGLNLNYVPSVHYTMTKTTPDSDDADAVNATELGVMVANFAVTF